MKEVMGIVIVLVVLAVFQLTSTLALSTTDNRPQDLTTAFTFATDLETAYDQARIEKKTIMLIVHKTYCHESQSLRPLLIESNAVQQSSKDFIMVSALDGQDSLAQNIRPDGGKYVPRIVFIDCNGKIIKNIYNLNQPQQSKHRYFYTTAGQVYNAMNRAKAFSKNIKCISNEF